MTPLHHLGVQMGPRLARLNHSPTQPQPPASGARCRKCLLHLTRGYVDSAEALIQLPSWFGLAASGVKLPCAKTSGSIPTSLPHHQKRVTGSTVFSKATPPKQTNASYGFRSYELVFLSLSQPEGLQEMVVPRSAGLLIRIAGSHLGIEPRLT